MLRTSTPTAITAIFKANGGGGVSRTGEPALCHDSGKDVAFGLKYSGLSRPEITARVQWALKPWVLTLKNSQPIPAGPFRRGERRVAIAGVLATKPQILLLMSPSPGLTYSRQHFLHFVTKINQAGTTIIMVSHNMEALAEYTRHLLVLAQGRLIDSGPTREVFIRLKQKHSGAFGQTEAQKITTLLAKNKLVLPAAVVTYDDLLSALKQELAGGGPG